MMFPRYTTYRGKRCRLLTLTGALAVYNTQKAQGKKPAIISTHEGYIITEAVFEKERGENNGK